MNKYKGPDKRKHPRAEANFIISYKIQRENSNSDLSQSKNVSQGGMALTTNRYFEKGTHLLMTIRFPFFPNKIKVTGEVVSSKEVVNNIIYETRIKFFGLDEAIARELDTFVKNKIKKEQS